MVDSQQVRDTIKLEFPASKGPRARRRRTTVLEFRAAEADIVPPRKFSDQDPLKLWAASTRELRSAPGNDPLHWILLSTRPIKTCAQAMEMLEFYRRLRTIETCFRTLKSGARIEDRHLDHADDLRKCLAFDAITAWRVFDIERTARASAELPAIKVLSREELETLDAMLEINGFRSASEQTEQRRQQHS